MARESCGQLSPGADPLICEILDSQSTTIGRDVHVEAARQYLPEQNAAEAAFRRLNRGRIQVQVNDRPWRMGAQNLIEEGCFS